MTGKQHRPKNVSRERLAADDCVSVCGGGAIVRLDCLYGGVDATAAYSLSPLFTGKGLGGGAIPATSEVEVRGDSPSPGASRQSLAASGERFRELQADASFLFWRWRTRSSTTAGSASVEVSPRLPGSSSAILRRMRRMILPERVLGRPGANWIRSGEAIGPISRRTHATKSLRSASEGSVPVISVT